MRSSFCVYVNRKNFLGKDVLADSALRKPRMTTTSKQGHRRLGVFIGSLGLAPSAECCYNHPPSCLQYLCLPT
jgi:hypothetical protein